MKQEGRRLTARDVERVINLLQILQTLLGSSIQCLRPPRDEHDRLLIAQDRRDLAEARRLVKRLREPKL